MTIQQIAADGRNWARFVRGVKKFATSEVGKQAQRLFISLITLLLVINGLNVVNNYVGRDFITAIENRKMAEFIGLAILYVGVFAASTGVAVYYRFIEERLGLLWREWLTRRLVNRYLEHPTYYRLNEGHLLNGKVENPDQRIAEDVRTFTATTLSFVLILLNAAITIVAFSGVLWSISPLLFVVAVLYATAGSFLTIALGHSLVGLNYRQLDKEANFRANLIHVREKAELVALLRREGRLRARLLLRLDDLIANARRIIAVNRNLGFFTTGYNYLIQIIPALIVAPLFIRGDVEFGVITQSAMAFSMLLGAFSLVITQFQSISSFAAGVRRLGSLMEGMDQAQSTVSAIEIRDDCQDLVYDRLTLRSPQDGRALVKNLSVTIPRGTRLLIVGPDSTAKLALFRATAGIWDTGEGHIIRPALDQILFLPERPYFPPGTLREALLRTGQERIVSDEQILATLRELELEQVLALAGGLDTEKDWENIFSMDEQQLLAFARLLLVGPRFAFLDRVDTALGPEQADRVLKMLSKHSIAYLALSHGRQGRRDTDEKLENYDAILELTGDGGWRWGAVQAGQVKMQGYPSTTSARCSSPSQSNGNLATPFSTGSGWPSNRAEATPEPP